MSENKSWWQKFQDWNKEFNAKQREENIKDAAISRQYWEDNPIGPTPAESMPFLGSGLKSEEDTREVRDQVSANKLKDINSKTRAANPTAFTSYIPERKEKEEGKLENDFQYYTRVKQEQAAILEARDAIESGVPKSEFYNDDETLAADTAAEVRKLTEKYKARAGIIKDIESRMYGPEVLSSYRENNGGKTLTKEQLLRVRTEAIEKDPETKRAAELHNDALENSKSSRSKLQADIRQGDDRIEIQRTQLENDNRINQWEMEHKTAESQRQFRNEQLRLRYEKERADADLTLRRDLAILGLEGQAEDRRYESERDRAQDKQMFILQLMKGLSSLGQGFSL